MRDRDIGRNIATIIEYTFIIIKRLPTKVFLILWSLLNIISIPVSYISSLFEYDKPKFTDFVNSINLSDIGFVLVTTLFLSLLISLIVGFYKFISESQYFFNCLIRQQAERPLLLNNNMIGNLICEIENCCVLNNNKDMVDEYFYVLEIRLADKDIIEITAKNKNLPIYERMIFEIFERKQLEDTYVYDPEGLAVVCRKSPASFTSFLIDTNPKESYWQETMKMLKINDIKPKDRYLKIYVPSILKHSTDESLIQILEGLKKL